MPKPYTDYSDHTDVFVKRNGPGRKGLVFPVKLFLLLKYIDLKEPHLKTIISWNHHGRSFKIHDHKQFRQLIMPRFFGSNSSDTFRRQLNFWGFKRILSSAASSGGPTSRAQTPPTENGSYYHEKFLRSKDYLCRLIRRQASSGNPLLNGAVPDFESMKALPPSEQHRLTTPESDDELFEMLLLPSSTNEDAGAIDSSNQSLDVVMPSDAEATSISATASNNPTSFSVPFNTLFSQQEALLLNNYIMTSSIPPPPVPLHTFDASSRPNEVVTGGNDRRIQAYHNLDLQQLLSDENEWQWRHLQPFPIGFQPPISHTESQEMDQFMKFIRIATERQYRNR